MFASRFVIHSGFSMRFVSKHQWLRHRLIADWRRVEDGSPNNCEPLGVGELMPRILKGWKLDEKQRGEEITAAWREIVGEFFGQHTAPDTIHRGVSDRPGPSLTIHHALNMEKSRLLARLQEPFSAPGIRPGTRSTGFGSPAPAPGSRASTTTSSLAPGLELVALDRVARALARRRTRGLDRLFAAAQRAAPRLEVDHRAGVVAEVAEQPPEALGAAHRAVGDDVDAVADPRREARRGELVGRRQRVAARRGPAGRERSCSTSRNAAPGMCASR